MAKILTLVRFTATLERPFEGGDWLFLRLPQDASDQLPARSQVSVEGKLNGFPFAVTLDPDSEGGHWMKVTPSVSTGAGVKAGDEVDFEMTPVAVEPEPEIPDDLHQALAATPVAMETWQATTAIARRDWITWMTQGRKAETRVIRLNKMMDMLSHGKKRVCCFDRSGLASKEFRCPIPAGD